MSVSDFDLAFTLFGISAIVGATMLLFAVLFAFQGRIIRWLWLDAGIAWALFVILGVGHAKGWW